ncbi:hypothetical protein ANN_19739 [Periplaneta americana]|uniref:Uncharacterized protein n=1 Tax=Periplaneta americana TaxID=6978 RepID=A0ABQ8SAP6_PERAM|nr:hypothetical protein ANN_19739 [Periplaneta americana]
MLAGNEFQSLGRAIVKEDEYEEVRWDVIVSIVSWRERVFRLWWEERNKVPPRNSSGIIVCAVFTTDACDVRGARPASHKSDYTRDKEHRLRVLENKVLRKIFGAKRDEVTEEWRKLHNTELHALYSSPDIIRNIKSRRLRWSGHVARRGESRNEYRVLVGRPEGKRPLGRPRRRWEDNIKIKLREVGYDDRDWINLAQGTNAELYSTILATTRLPVKDESSTGTVVQIRGSWCQMFHMTDSSHAEDLSLSSSVLQHCTCYIYGGNSTYVRI